MHDYLGGDVFNQRVQTSGVSQVSADQVCHTADRHERHLRGETMNLITARRQQRR
jgi:hypothetical protein